MNHTTLSAQRLGRVALLLSLSLTPSPLFAEGREGGTPSQLKTLEGGRVVLAHPRAAAHLTALTLPATVSTSPRSHWDLAPHTDGHLVTWRVHIGDVVEEGEALADVAPYQLIDLKARVRAMSRVSAARGKLYNSLKRQVGSGALSRQRLDEAEASWEEAKAELSEARQALKARAKHAAHPTVWHSPMRGVVTDIKCAPGAHLDAGAACVTLSDVSQKVIELTAPYSTLSRFKVGAHAKWSSLTPPAQGSAQASESVPMTLSLLVPPSERGGVIGRALFEPAQGAMLPATGRVGRLELLSPAPSEAVWLPYASVVEWGGQARVFVEQQGLLEALEVERVGEAEGGVVVRASALNAESMVVVRGAFLLKSRALLAEE